ncbi:hypothetical protein CLU96_1266 [Chryseobacterium sp. 52]|uniref:bacteriocin-like protein n=1 Tax=Chryseobacterium sp. 52 TaxID=2035213 RepID=UPI000C636371|nr:hypothetical protein [Chryseobacterium sp. 52]PIF44323.1 hypothetical protein CLU96_1266 [Chryseobacterium sp. 52]
MKNLKKISKEDLKSVRGGMNWTDDRCGNVIDLRSGARPVIVQQISNWWCSTFG